jgi:Zn-dependent protease
MTVSSTPEESVLSAETIAVGLMSYVVLLFSLSVHESAHAWTALKQGDPTAQSLGRISLNPLVHVDVIGTVVMPLLMIFTGIPLLGWAKPTPVDPRYFKDLRRGQIVVSGAGPASNLLLAVFNLVPLPPLDGSHIVEWALPNGVGHRAMRAVAPYGGLILLALVMSGALWTALSPVHEAIVGLLYSLVR